MEFKSFEKVKQVGELFMKVTQKIHGTNAQIYIYEYTSMNGETHEPKIGIKAGSRNRWIYPADDNYGFAAFVEENREALINFLGVGLHYGEWAGPGINSDEGLTQKTWVLFDPWRYKATKLEDYPPCVIPVPVLYVGAISMDAIDSIMKDLKINGSKLSPGFMQPEGIVISVNGTRYKKVFSSEETAWKSIEKKEKVRIEEIDFNYLCQPLRLEKLLSKDERYLREYPESLVKIVKDYLADLVEEKQIIGEEGLIKSICKGASSTTFNFVKEYIKEIENERK